MEERWMRWEVPTGVSQKYHINEIFNTKTAFTLRLIEDDDNALFDVCVTFERPIYAYRFTDESYRLTFISYLGKQYEGSFCGFFKVENSLYIQELLGNMPVMAQGVQVTHFCFQSPDTYLDIVATKEPRFEFVEKKII